MVVYRCDGCGKELHRHQLRYTVKIDVRAAYDQLEVGLADLLRDHRAELEALVRRLGSAGPDQLEESVYKSLSLDLCPECHRSYIRNPLNFDPKGKQPDRPFDIDSFLRSLGYGTGTDEESD